MCGSNRSRQFCDSNLIVIPRAIAHRKAIYEELHPATKQHVAGASVDGDRAGGCQIDANLHAASVILLLLSLTISHLRLFFG